VTSVTVSNHVREMSAGRAAPAGVAARRGLRRRASFAR
jgi:hypothetical protein